MTQNNADTIYWSQCTKYLSASWCRFCINCQRVSLLHCIDGNCIVCLFQFLSKNGIYEFWNWFDDRTWYLIVVTLLFMINSLCIFLIIFFPKFYLVHCIFLSFCRYPLGRVIGGTVYPGLTLTAGTMWWYVQALFLV